MSKIALALIVAASAFLVGPTARAEVPHVEYEPVNLVGGDGGHMLTGDIIIRRYDGHVEFADFMARSNGQFMSSGSLNYPVTDASMTVVDVGGGGVDPGGGQHVHSISKPGDQQIEWVPVVVGATCASMYAMLRAWCSMDCSPNGVARWNAGYCGASSTCICNAPPLPLPTIGRPFGPLGMGSVHLVAFSWSSFWLHP